MMANSITDLHLCAATVLVPGLSSLHLQRRRQDPQENIRLSTLAEFRNHYDDDTITREQIFYYVYAVLHHPDYRERYAENLKRELPRIPLAGTAEDFHAFARPAASWPTCTSATSR